MYYLVPSVVDVSPVKSGNVASVGEEFRRAHSMPVTFLRCWHAAYKLVMLWRKKRGSQPGLPKGPQQTRGEGIMELT